MISQDISYIRPETVEEAMQAWAEHTGRPAGNAQTEKGQTEKAQSENTPAVNTDGVRYLGGGTELITGARKTGLTGKPFRVLIDLKHVSETRRMENSGGRIFLGSTLSLNEIGDSGIFPLLTATIRNIADRTTRNRLSLGGNIAGTLPYREAVLPLLLADATIHTMRPVLADDLNLSLRQERLLREIFNKRLPLQAGELILGFSFPAEAAALPWRHYRATRTGPVDYPLVTACFMGIAGGDNAREGARRAVIAAAFSGLFPYPTWYESVDAANAALAIPGLVRSDQRASAEYRQALISDMVRRAQEELA